MFVKICGITRPEDAVVAERAGADAIGMIFVAGSKRQVDVGVASAIVDAVGPFVTKVGVFRNASIEDVRSTSARLRLDVVQLHGSEDPAYVRALRDRFTVIKAVSFSPDLTTESVSSYGADAILLDGLDPGSGVPFAWEGAAAFKAYPRLVLAGGLDADNVARAIEAMAPYAVDVASGVEASPGIKDAAEVQRFVTAAKTPSRRDLEVRPGNPGT